MIQNHHMKKLAYIYIRQSTLAQVRFNQESTERQYALKEKALKLGWDINMIKILDQDLGVSGAHISGREDFKTLVADVAMNKVGAVFALEVSRLSRSSTDWNNLLDLCSLTDTLIIDEDGCYDLSDFNAQILLGFKGTMSQAELHLIRSRLLGGRLNKAKKGKLNIPLPTGFVYDEEDNIVFDPDKEVFNIINLVFKSFQELGSAYSILQKFFRLGLKFPKRQYGGIWDGRLTWDNLSYKRILDIIKNPCYAGVYAYGKSKQEKSISPEGNIKINEKELPMSSWIVLIKEHHEGYITYDEFVSNKEKLKLNISTKEENVLSGPAREGVGLLQGLLLCGNCGRKITMRYKISSSIHPIYHCIWAKNAGISEKTCLSVNSKYLDERVSQRVLEVLKPEQINLALKALHELDSRNESVSKQWEMKIQRAEYESQLAQKRYEQVDPFNRLVASTLEKNWNDKLVNLEEIKKEFSEYQNSNLLSITNEQKKELFEIAKDFPKLWESPSTQMKDKKRILRLLIKDITIEINDRNVILHIRWQGGAVEDIIVNSLSGRINYSQEIIEIIEKLSNEKDDEEISDELNKKGYSTGTGKLFTINTIKSIRQKYKILSLKQRTSDNIKVKDIAKKFQVSNQTVYYWIDHGVINAKRKRAGSHYSIVLPPEKEKEIYERINSSSKIKQKHQHLEILF